MTNRILIVWMGMLFSCQGLLHAQLIGLTTENDAYFLKTEDAYYTNGLFFHYSYAKSGKSGSRQIHQFMVGQKIFTPLFRNTQTPADIDRPYAGYSFAQYSQTHFLGTFGTF